MIDTLTRKLSPRSPPTPLARYGFALLVAAAAILLRLALSPWLELRQPFITVYLAVLVVALWAGGRAGLLTLALAIPACILLFVEPGLQLPPRQGGKWLPPVLATLVSVAIIALADAHRSARLRAVRLAHRARSAAATLRDSERRFRATFDQAAIGIGHADASGRWILANDRLAKILGYSREQLLARDFQSVTHPDDLDACLAGICALLAGDIDTYDAEKRFVRADGTPIWTHVTVSTVRENAHAGAHYLAAVIQDITPRKLAENDLQRSNQRLAFVARTAEELLLTDDPRGFLDSLFTRLSELLHLEVYFHYEADEKEGRLRLAAYRGIDAATAQAISNLRFGEAVCGTTAARRTRTVVDDVQGSSDPATALIRTLGVTAYACHPLVAHDRLLGTLSFGTRDGAVFDDDTLALLRAVSDQVAVAIDRHRTQTELRESDERLRFAQAAAGAGAWEWNPITNDLLLSPEAHAILGYDAADLPPTTESWLRGLLHPGDRDLVERELRDVAERHRDLDIQYRILHPARGLRWIHSRGRPALGPSGEAERVAGIVLDITDRKLAEEALRFLADAGGVLASSLDYQTTLTQVAQMAVPRFADWCVVDLLDGSGLAHRVAVSHADPSKLAFAREFEAHYPPRPDAPFGAAAVIRSGQPQLVPNVHLAHLTAIAHDQEHLRLLTQLGPCSYIAVPLTARGRILGALSFISTDSGRRYDEGDLALASELAARAAIAIDNSRLYEAQQESEEQYRTLVEQVGDYAIFRIDTANRVVSWNEGVRRVLGFDEDEFLDADIITTIFTPEDIAAGIPYLELAEAARNGSASNDRWMRRKDGARFHANGITAALRDDRGELIGFTKVMRDLTEQYLWQEEVRISEERFRALSTATFDALLIHDQGVALEVNRAFEELFGYARDEVIGRQCTPMVVAPESIPVVKEHIESGSEELYEAQLRRKDGSTFTAEVRARNITYQGRAVRVTSARDVTERKRSQQELARHRDHLQEILRERTAELDASHQQLRLSERLAALGTLAAGLGHDMGNLLLPLRTRLESIEAEVRDETVLADVAAIRRAADYLQRLTHGLRLLALDPDEAQARGAGTDLHDWWPDAEPLLRNALPGGVTLEHRLAGGPLAVTLARPGLTQAVFNLVQNAGQAMRKQPGGVVTVWADTPPDGRTIRLGVTDTGPGMAPDVVRHCLEPFFTTKARTHATGMGLALVNASVQKVGGSIEVHSEPGHGATFILHLPAAAPADGRPAPRPSAAVSVADERLSSYIESILLALDFSPRAGRPSPDDCLWIADAESANNGGIGEFLGASEHRRIVLFADPPVRGDDGRITAIGPSPKPATIREAIRSAVPGCLDR